VGKRSALSFFSQPIQRVNYCYHSRISNNLLGRTINFFETGLPTEHSVEMVVESVVCVWICVCEVHCVDQTRASIYFCSTWMHSSHYAAVQEFVEAWRLVCLCCFLPLEYGITFLSLIFVLLQICQFSHVVLYVNNAGCCICCLPFVWSTFKVSASVGTVPEYTVIYYAAFLVKWLVIGRMWADIVWVLY